PSRSTLFPYTTLFRSRDSPAQLIRFARAWLRNQPGTLRLAQRTHRRHPLGVARIKILGELLGEHVLDRREGGDHAARTGAQECTLQAGHAGGVLWWTDRTLAGAQEDQFGIPAPR